jgi:prepilin-type N-terminal cleavage/methylation domain-containing protein
MEARRGFTLIEVAMALAVTGGALAVMLQLFGDGGQRADRASAERLGLLVAQSALAGAGAEAPLAAGAAWSGVSAGLGWQVSVAEWPEAAAGPQQPPLLLVVAAVQGPQGQELARLATLRLGPPPQGGARAR